MTDFTPPSDNPFDQIDPHSTQVEYPTHADAPAAGANSPAPAAANPFDAEDFNLSPDQGPQTTALGAFATHAALGAVPAVGGLAGAGAGAAAGAEIGALAAPIAEFTVPAGALIGGLVGAFGGGYGASKAQEYAIDELPQSYRDPLKETLAAQEKQHPTASFSGGLVPYAVTMNPVGAEGVAAREALMGRLFSGAIVGGQQLGSDVASGNPIDWTNVGIATGFGLLFPNTNPLGETIVGAGRSAVRPFLPEHPPTVIGAADAGIFQPESVFMGDEAPNPTIARNNADARSQELALLTRPPQPDIHDVARQIDPYMFEKRDELATREQELQKQLENFVAPPPEALRDLNDQRITLQTQLDEHVAERNGYAGGPEARRLRAQVRDLDRQISDLQKRRQYAEAGREVPSEEAANLRSQITDVQREIYDITPSIVSAYRQASERLGSEVVEHTSPEHMLALPAPDAIPDEMGEPPARPVAPAPVAIVDDVRQKLMDAGRPPEEADAAAKLESAYYTTLARDFNTTPEALYASEAANIEQNLKRGGQGSFTAGAATRTITMFRDADHSTIIHEKGHEYLDRMLRFAARPDAPEDFKARAQKALDWMGLNSAADLDAGLTGEAKKRATRAQEKFARGFEQYLREGVAPSKELAGVFARFRDWLTTIYQTIKGLGKPINDDIRGVFDRMLTTKPQRIVVAPEKPTLPMSLADLHELDRAHAEPQDAEPVADQIVSEATQAAAALPPEVRNEIAAEHERQNSVVAPEAGANATGEVAGGAGAGRQVGLRGLEPEPVSAGEAGGEQSGEKLGGGQKPVRESAGSPAAGERDAGQRPAARSVAPVAAPRLDNVRTPAVDKLGNIRLENITSVEEFRAAMRASAEMNMEAVTPGRATMSEMMEVASVAGLRPGDINEKALADMFGGYDRIRQGIWNLRNALVDQAQIVSEAMKRLNASGSDEDAIRVSMESEKHLMMLSTLSKVQAEAARTLGMPFRNLEFWNAVKAQGEVAKEMQDKTLYQIKKIAKLAARYDTPAKLATFLQKAQSRSYGRMLLEYWINGLISGPATHTTYAIGNEILSLHDATFETGTAAAIGAVRKMLGQERERVQFGEVGAKLEAHFGSGLRAGLQAGGEALRSGVTTYLPDETARPLMPFQGDADIMVSNQITNAPVSWQELGAGAFGAVRGIRDSMLATMELVKAGGVEDAPRFGMKYSPLGQIGDFQIKGVTAFPLGTLIRLPGRAIASFHSFFRTSGYTMENAAGAYREALKEVHAGTVSPEDFASRVAYWRENPTAEMMERYRAAATDRTLMGAGGELVKLVSRLTNLEFPVPGLGKTPLLKFIDPFVHIAANVIDQSIVKRTPVGLLSPELRATLMGNNGPIAQDMAQARMLVGSMMAIGVGTLAAEGLISGSAPKDAKERAVWLMAGNQPYSVRIGDTWYDMHRLGPLGMLTGVSADLYNVAHLLNENELLAAAAELQHAFMQNVLDESFMRGPAELMQAIEDPGRYGQNYIKNMLSSFTPYSVGSSQIARAVDPYSRRARTVTDAILAKIPYESEKLWPNIDIWGQPIPSRDALGAPGVTAIYETRISNDPVNRAMLEDRVFPAKIGRKVKNILLNDEQYDYLARTAGRLAKERLDTFVTSDQYQRMSTNDRHYAMTKFITDARTTARGMTLMKFPDLARAAFEAQARRQTGQPAK